MSDEWDVADPDGDGGDSYYDQQDDAGWPDDQPLSDNDWAQE